MCKTVEARSYFEICTNLCVFLSVFLLLLAQSNWVVCCAPSYLRGDNATWESSSRVQFLLDFFSQKPECLGELKVFSDYGKDRRTSEKSRVKETLRKKKLFHWAS